MARTTGVSHATYKLQTGERALDPADVKLYPSKGAALEDAVDEGARYVPWSHGKTLAEAIEDYAASRARAKQGRTPGTSGSSTPPKAATS